MRRGPAPSEPIALEEQLGSALVLAYQYLESRERTVNEMRLYLERQAIAADVLEQAMDILQSDGYLDDRRFTNLFVEDKRNLDGWGNRRLRQVLRRRGVPAELVEQTLVEEQPSNELHRALELLERRFPSPPSTRRDRDRALGVLGRKGYDSDVAYEALVKHTRAAGAEVQ